MSLAWVQTLNPNPKPKTLNPKVHVLGMGAGTEPIP